MSKQKKSQNISVEALKVTLIKKKECSAKALATVERWIEGVVAEDDLLDNLYYITQDHFQDVIEERAILKNCGYPLCANKLKNIPSKQFHISTQLNKVFDIRDRKNFCSNLCYKAARYLKDQLLTSPLWLRNEKECFSVKLLSLDKTQGSSGIEVDLGHQGPAKPESEEFTSVLNFTTKSLTRLSKKVDKFEEHEENTKKTPTYTENVINENKNIVTKDDGWLDLSRTDITDLDLNRIQNEFNVQLFQGEKEMNRDEVNMKFENQCNENICQNKNIDKICLNYDKRKVKCNVVVDNEKYKDKEKYKDNEKHKENEGIHSEKENKVQETKASSLKNEVLLGKKLDKSVHTDCAIKTSEMTTTKAGKESKCKRKDKNKNNKTNFTKEIPSMLNVVIRIEQCLREWCTIDTLCYVFGEEKVKEMLKDKGESIKEYRSMEGGAPIDPHLYERYLMICRKLNIIELEDSKLDAEIKDEVKGPQKPLPDYSVLKEEAKNIELKVKSFFHGDKVVTFKEDSAVPEDEKPSVIPLVDLHAQKSLRRRIVLDRLIRILPDLGQMLGLKDLYLTQDVRMLISTFNLSANNITFKPIEWNLIALAVFKLLAIKNKLLDQTLSSEASSKNLTLLLLSYQLDGGYLNRLAVWLTDIDYVLRSKS